MIYGARTGPSTPKKEGRGSMNRRHLVSLVLAATATLSITSVAAAGALAPPVAIPNAAPAAFHAQDASPASATLAHEAVIAQRAHAAAVEALASVDGAKVAEALQAHDAVQSSMWACIRSAESGNNYGITSGAYGILISTWDAYSSIWSKWGSYSVPGAAPPSVQDLFAYKLYLIGGGYGGWHDRCTGY